MKIPARIRKMADSMVAFTLQRRLLAAAHEMVLASNYVPATGEKSMKHEHWCRWVDAHVRLRQCVQDLRRLERVSKEKP